MKRVSRTTKNGKSVSASNTLTGLKSNDFSILEDKDEAFKKIGVIAKRAGKRAAVAAKAHGVGVVYARKNKLVKIMPDGTELNIEPINKERAYYTKVDANKILLPVEK